MFPVLALGIAIWSIGHVMKAPKEARLLMLGLLYLAVLGIHIALPTGHPIRLSLGESATPWLLLAGFIGLVLLYRKGLRALRSRSDAQNAFPAPRQDGPFSDEELTRYARHIVLREIGGGGQRALKDAKVLVIGAGGLGSPALLYLAGAGVGTIGVIDDDIVSPSNLQRQIIHTDARGDMPKVFSAEIAMKALNPHVIVRPYNRKFSEEIASELLQDYDLVLDGCDSFETRALVNKACVAAGVPLISGAIAQWDGQLALYHPKAGGPCFSCVFPNAPAPGQAATCAEAGVAGPLPGVIGTMMALEAVKVLTQAGDGLGTQMLLYDGLSGTTRSVKIARDPGCQVCGKAKP